MKSTVKVVVEVEKKELPYPKLMIVSRVGKVVLMTSRGCGTVVKCGKDQEEAQPLGYALDCWSMDSFEDFKGELVLENDKAEDAEGRLFIRNVSDDTVDIEIDGIYEVIGETKLFYSFLDDSGDLRSRTKRNYTIHMRK